MPSGMAIPHTISNGCTSMRDIGEGTIRRIDWQELTPVVLLARVPAVASGFRVLFLGLTGILLTILVGYMINGMVLMTKISADRGLENGPLLPRANAIAASPRMNELYSSPTYIEPLIDFRSEKRMSFRSDPIGFSWRLLQRSVLVPWDLFSAAGSRFLSLKAATWGERGIALLWLVFLLGVWSFVGGITCRTAGLRFSLDQSDSFGSHARFFQKRGWGYFSSLLIVSLGILVCLGLAWLAVCLYSFPVGNYISAFLFPFSLLFALGAVYLGVVLLLGWPIMFAAVSVEGVDGFDAISRTFSYLQQRPFHYLFYWGASGVLGVICFVFLSLFLDGAVYVAIHVGGLPSHVAIGSFGDLVLPKQSENLSLPECIVLCWCAMMQLLKLAFIFGWFWATATAIYLMLRRSVDGTPLDEIFRFGSNAAPPRKLPKIRNDDKGAPVVES